MAKRKESMTINDLEICGFDWALTAMRMPYMSHNNKHNDDMDLAKILIKAGPEHRKFLRQVTIQMDVTASMAFWFEFDTYKVGVTSNSESFWNTISKTGRIPFGKFSVPEGADDGYEEALQNIVDIINRYWAESDAPKEVVRYLVPQGVKYTRIVTMTGESFYNMLHQRKNHRLPEWRNFIRIAMAMIEKHWEPVHAMLLTERARDE